MTKGILTFLIKEEDSLVTLKDNIFHFGKVIQIGLNSSKIIFKVWKLGLFISNCQ